MAKLRRTHIFAAAYIQSQHLRIAENSQNPAHRQKNGPPSGQTVTYQKTEVIQSYLRIWGTYDPIESGPSEPKKGVYMGVA